MVRSPSWSRRPRPRCCASCRRRSPTRGSTPTPPSSASLSTSGEELRITVTDNGRGFRHGGGGRRLRPRQHAAAGRTHRGHADDQLSAARRHARRAVDAAQPRGGDRWRRMSRCASCSSTTTRSSVRRSGRRWRGTTSRSSARRRRRGGDRAGAHAAARPAAPRHRHARHERDRGGSRARAAAARDADRDADGVDGSPRPARRDAARRVRLPHEGPHRRGAAAGRARPPARRPADVAPTRPRWSSTSSGQRSGSAEVDTLGSAPRDEVLRLLADGMTDREIARPGDLTADGREPRQQRAAQARRPESGGGCAAVPPGIVTGASSGRVLSMRPRSPDDRLRTRARPAPGRRASMPRRGSVGGWRSAHRQPALASADVSKASWAIASDAGVLGAAAAADASRSASVPAPEGVGGRSAPGRIGHCRALVRLTMGVWRGSTSRVGADGSLDDSSRPHPPVDRDLGAQQRGRSRSS